MRGSLVQRINLSWIGGRDVHYSMDEPSPIYVERSSQGKPCLDSFKPVQRFGAKHLPHRTPHKMSECLGPTLV